MPPTETYRAFEVQPPEEAEPCGDPVGVQEIAERLGLESRSVHMIGRRGQLPPPDHMTNGFRAWEWRKILWWAGETDRLRTPALLREYETVFGHGPSATRETRPAPGVVTRVDPRPKVPKLPGPAKTNGKTKKTSSAATKTKAKAKAG